MLAAQRWATKSRMCMAARRREDMLGIIEGGGDDDDGIAASHSQASTHGSVFVGEMHNAQRWEQKPSSGCDGIDAGQGKV